MRRLINLRLKVNGIFWDESYASVLLQQHAHVIADRWDERIATMRRLERKHGRKDRRRESQPMSKKAEPEAKVGKLPWKSAETRVREIGTRPRRFGIG